jgi:hypothetical protein
MEKFMLSLILIFSYNTKVRSLLHFIEKARTIDRDVVRAMGIFIFIVLIGSIVYARLEGWSYLDSTYFSVITLTTIGYGDMHPIQETPKYLPYSMYFWSDWYLSPQRLPDIYSRMRKKKYSGWIKHWHI